MILNFNLDTLSFIPHKKQGNCAINQIEISPWPLKFPTNKTTEVDIFARFFYFIFPLIFKYFQVPDKPDDHKQHYQGCDMAPPSLTIEASFIHFFHIKEVCDTSIR